MSLSNTATPKYYAKFRDTVLRGEIPVCREISMEMNRIDKLIADSRYYYDDEAIDGFIRFCEGELTLTDGSAVKMLDTFGLWAESLLSWFYFQDKSVYEPGKRGSSGHYVRKRVKRRLRKKQFIITARGSAKSMYISFLQAYFLTVDGRTTHQITTAPTMRQAEEVMSPLKTAIVRARGPLFKFLTFGSLQNTTGKRALRQKLVSTKKGVENFLTNSLLEVRPMTIDKLQGLRCLVATVDEWLSGDIKEDVVGAIEQGASKNDDYVIVCVSSEGTVRNRAGDDIKMELMRTLKGEYTNMQTSIWYYRLDDVAEVAHPDLWVKANPNLGQTVSYEVYQEDVEKAENNPASRNDILAKRFGIPLEGYTYFFTYEETKVHRSREFWEMSCAMGADLSRGDDFCSFTFLFPLTCGEFGVKTRAYITEYTLNNLPPAMRVKYEDFINEGSLVIMNGVRLEMKDVYDDLDQYIYDCRYDVCCFGYDPYNAKEFVEWWSNDHGPMGVEKVIQGFKTESVPLGELKNLAHERLLLFDQDIMQFTMGNCITLEDTNANRKLYKNRADQKIDCVAALVDAYVAYKHNLMMFE